jgi:protein-disulfide isomerase
VAQAKSSGSKPGNDSRSGKPSNATGTGPGSAGRSTSGGRQSVAAARQTKPNSNRTQLIIGAVAVALIAIVVIVGLVLNKKQNASPVTDYPKSVSSTSTVKDGIITVTGPPSGTGVTNIDLYEDGLCPACQAFEGQFGQQIMKAVDQGKLTVRYHFLNFLNPKSASKDYSTRASAAFQCVGAVPAAQAPKGLFLNFHTTMFSSGTQPAEGGKTDLSNADIAAIAVKSGAPPAAATCITSGANIDQAKTTATASAATLAALAPNGAYGTPSATKDGQLLDLNDPAWLTNLLA